MKNIAIQDVTLRDGMQQKGVLKHFKAKCEAVRLLSQTDIPNLEIGMCTTPQDVKILKELIGYVKEEQVCTVLSRLIDRDIQLAGSLTNGPLGIKLLVPVSKRHMETKLKWNRTDLIQRMESCMKLVTGLGKTLEICLEDATRAEEADLFQVLDVCSRYPVTFVTVCDTVGCMSPDEYGAFIKKIAKRVPLPLSVHCHNDMGLATANAFAGVLGGASRVETTFLGIGERAGNTAMDEIVYLLYKKGFQCPVPLPQLMMASRDMEEILGYQSAPIKPIIGKNVFTHEAGIHQNGLLKQPEMYQSVLPNEFGISEPYQMSLTGISSSRLLCKRAGRYMGRPQDDKAVLQVVTAYKALSNVIAHVQIEEVCDLYLLDGGML